MRLPPEGQGCTNPIKYCLFNELAQLLYRHSWWPNNEWLLVASITISLGDELITMKSGAYVIRDGNIHAYTLS